MLGRSFPARSAIAADAAEVLSALLDAADFGQPDPARATANARDWAAYEEASAPPASATLPQLVDPAPVVAELLRRLPPEAILTCDAGNFWGWFARYSRFRRPRTLLGPTSGAMGYGVPAAVAAVLVTENRRPVVALAGDGGFLMTGNELEVAAQLGLKVTCLVFNNALYGTIRLHQERDYPGRVTGTELWNPDFVRYAEASGGLGVRVERNEDIADALAVAFEHPGIAVVEVADSRETIAIGQTLNRLSTPPA